MAALEFFWPFFFSTQHKLLLQEVGGAFSSSLTFLWTKYIKSLLLRRLKSCNSGCNRDIKGIHQHHTNLKPVYDSFNSGFTLSMHVKCRICIQLPVRATKQVSAETLSFLSWRIYEDLWGDKRFSCTVCLGGIITFNCALPSNIQEVPGVQRPCLITDGGCRWLKAGALQKGGKE